MKSYRIILLVAFLVLASCAPKAKLECVLEGAPESQVVIKQLAGGAYAVVDTVMTNSKGEFSYKIPVVEGQPEFYYFYYSDKKIFSLLLELPEKISVKADTLGRWTVEGSPESEKLRQTELEFSKFISQMAALASSPNPSSAKMSRLYIDYYRSRVRYIMENAGSMTVVPVLYEKINDNTPVFSQVTDAIHYRKACDSLKVKYPDSRYLVSLEQEAKTLENRLQMSHKLSQTNIINYPDIVLPDISGKNKSLLSVESKAVLIHFWNPNSVPQKMYNLDVLKPIYDEFHPQGLEIYAVAICPDKAMWANVVGSQKMPWINVCDKALNGSIAAASYNVTKVPTTILVTEDESIVAVGISGDSALRRELTRVLK